MKLGPLQEALEEGNDFNPSEGKKIIKIFTFS